MLKKVLALALAGAMVIGSMSIAPFAATTDMTADNTIKISGLKEGDQVNLYKVVGWTNANDTANYNPNNWGGWVVTDGFKNVIQTSDALGNIIDTRKTGYTGLTSEIAGDLSRSGDKASSLVAGSPFTVQEDKDYIEVTPVDLGMYMAIITPADVDTVYNPVFVSADWSQANTPDTSEWIVTSDTSYSLVGGAQGAAKKTTLKLDKSSKNDSDKEYENDGEPNSDKGDTTKKDDVLTFTVDTTIPGYGKTFDHPRFVLKDSMDTLQYLKDIEVKAGSTTLTGIALGAGEDLDTVLKENTTAQYIIVKSEDEGYEISFTEKYLKSLAAPTAIVATYTAKVLAPEAYENVNKEQNTVEIEYSHNPETETEGKPGGDKEYQKDITNHYTFSIDANNIAGKPGAIGESMTEIIKVAVDREGNPIYSEKEVRSKVTTTNAVKSPLEGCVFELRSVTRPGVTKRVTSDSNGRLLFEDLDEGEYELEEISAPTGWVRDTTIHHIVIDAVLAEKTYTEYYDQDGNWYDKAGTGLTEFTYKADELESVTITFDGSTVADHTFDHNPTGSSEIKWSSAGSRELPSSIHNTQGVELPSTGGIGTTIFYAGGAVLVLLAGVLLVSKRRIA